MLSKQKEIVNLLELTPLRKKEFDLDDQGIVTVKIPRFTNKILVKLLIPRLKKPLMRVKLDDVGSSVWKEINGETSVADIARKLEQKYGDTFVQAPERVAEFLKQMYFNDFISFKEFPNKNKG